MLAPGSAMAKDGRSAREAGIAGQARVAATQVGPQEQCQGAALQLQLVVVLAAAVGAD